MRNKDVFMSINEWGNLYLYDVLAEYIYPRIFVCKDDFECKYLFYEMSGDDTQDTWLVTKLRTSDFYDIIDHKRCIQWVFTNSKKSQLYSVVKTYSPKEEIKLYPDGERWLDRLPGNDVYPDKPAADAGDAIETLAAARETGNVIFDIRLYPGTDRHVVPQSIMKSLCESFSSFTGSIYGMRHGDSLQVQTAPGSCIVRFSIDNDINLLTDTNPVNESKIINKILNDQSIEDSLGIVKNKKSCVDSYRRIMETLLKTGSSTQFVSAGPGSVSANVINLPQEEISSRINKVDKMFEEVKESIYVQGRLVALDLKTGKFKMEVDEEMISGDVDNSVMEMNSYVVPQCYNANISVTRTFDRQQYKKKTHYRLTGLKVVLS